MTKKYFMLLMLLIGASGFAVAQQVTGNVTDDNSNSLPGVSVAIQGTSTGVITDFDGNYTVNAKNGDVLVFSYVGFDTQKIKVSGSKIDVSLKSGMSLDEVVLVGNRAKPRTILDSPVPIDNIGVKELTSGGQPTLEAMLTFKVPSFNAQSQAILTQRLITIQQIFVV